MGFYRPTIWEGVLDNDAYDTEQGTSHVTVHVGLACLRFRVWDSGLKVQPNPNLYGLVMLLDSTTATRPGLGMYNTPAKGRRRQQPALGPCNLRFRFYSNFSLAGVTGARSWVL